MDEGLVEAEASAEEAFGAHFSGFGYGHFRRAVVDEIERDVFGVEGARGGTGALCVVVRRAVGGGDVTEFDTEAVAEFIGDFERGDHAAPVTAGGEDIGDAISLTAVRGDDFVRGNVAEVEFAKEGGVVFFVGEDDGWGGGRLWAGEFGLEVLRRTGKARAISPSGPAGGTESQGEERPAKKLPSGSGGLPFSVIFARHVVGQAWHRYRFVPRSDYRGN